MSTKSDNAIAIDDQIPLTVILIICCDQDPRLYHVLCMEQEQGQCRLTSKLSNLL